MNSVSSGAPALAHSSDYLRLRRFVRSALCLLAVSVFWDREAVAQNTAPQAAAFLFVKQHCLACHGETEPKAELSLAKFGDEASILKARKTWLKILQMVEQGEMPPKEKPKPTADEVANFAKAVNDIFDRADKNAKPDPGRVTIRRLNRVEYNNTIRDLVGVDFNPAEDFPSDDIGHGFDNIGDVLSLSPVLMERYLAAAESIMQRAIMPDPAKPPVRTQSSRYLEPATSEAAHWRPLIKGNLNTPYSLSLSGDYTFKIRCYTKNSGDEPVKIAVQLDGDDVKQFEVKATDEKTPETIMLPIFLPDGKLRIAVRLLNPTEGDKPENPRTLMVEWFELSGPADTRPASQRKIMACSPDKPKSEQTREILQRFATKAYRRPATKDEVDRLAKLVETVETSGEKYDAAIQFALQAVLVSPKFLFRVELDDRPDSADAHAIDEFQLASRLSYFLWSTMPDDELFALAEKKELTTNLDVQIRRMLKDAKSKSLVENFALQWLQLRRLTTVAADATLFPTFNDRLKADMLKETSLFLTEIIQEDRSITDLLDADFTYLNERLAKHYGIADTNGNLAGQKPTNPGGQPIRRDEFQRVILQDRSRGGLLTQASVLTVTSNPTRTSPVKRGRWVLEQILGTPPPPPPPNVPELPMDEKAIMTGSLRQRLEEHRKNPACASCHDKMDALGFALENFNAVGGFRLKDGEFDIDSSGTLPDGKSFKGSAELKSILVEKKDQFARCLAEKLLIYGTGRGLDYYDKRTVDRIVAATGKDGYKFSTLIIEIAKSDPFRQRRGSAQGDQE